MKTLFVIGLGLIGSSVARGVRKEGLFKRIVGFDVDEGVAHAAVVATNVCDEIAPNIAQGALQADLTLIATPVGTLHCVLQQIAPSMREMVNEERCVTDVGSVKVGLITAAIEVFGAMPGWLVPGHPLAGSEQSGLHAGSADLFRDHKVLLCPTSTTLPSALQAVEYLWRGLGATIEHLNATEHDRLLAMTSHLPHLLAFGLVDALLEVEPAATLFRYAGGGFRDVTRLASSDPLMWRDISLHNAQPLLAALDHITAHVARLREAIAHGDGDALLAAFMRAKQARDGEL